MAFSIPAAFPAFPSNIAVFPTGTLSLEKLLAEESTEVNRLFDACCSTGLFLLNLSDTKEGRELIHDVDEMFRVSETIFELDLETKNKYLMRGGTVLG